MEFEGVAGLGAFDVDGAGEDVTAGATILHLVFDGGEGGRNLVFGDAEASVLGGGAREGFDNDSVA